MFYTHHTETAMLRYLRAAVGARLRPGPRHDPARLVHDEAQRHHRDGAGRLPGFADLHPFAPAEDAAGYRELVEQLEGWLAEVTGYDRVSIQPNAGSQGELAGLLAIRGYHRANGEEQRDVCLIPSSAHGTNAASAVMAGMRVVVVKAADDGDVDLDDLRAQCEEHADDLAAIMVTYPSTHGVYEDAHHRAVPDRARARRPGLRRRREPQRAARATPSPASSAATSPTSTCTRRSASRTAAAVPGVGPVAVRAHLAPYLPRHPMHPDADRARGHRPDQRGAVRLGRHPADLVGLRPA